MENQESLPRTQTDLPLPEKELPAEIRGFTPNHPENKKLKLNPKWLVIGIVTFFILFIGLTTAYILGVNNANKEIACTMEAKICPDGSSVGRTGPACEFAPCPTASSSTDSSAGWNKETITLEGNNAKFGNYKTNVILNIPQGWNLTTSNSAGCTNGQITNGKGFTMNLKFICEGWAAKYSNWPTDAKIVLEQNQTNHSGQITKYRFRYKNTNTTYSYIDADEKNKAMDALMIGFPPPNESSNDYYFEVANLTTSDGTQADLEIADKIASTLFIESLDRDK